MKALLEKIRKILRDRRTRKFLTRFVSGVAALVVFVTTYALVLPAITMESQAECGVEAHQHDDSCYSENLVCGQEESEGHHHTEDCYTVTRELVCPLEEHEHSSESGCFAEDGSLICTLEEHTHGDFCYEESRELTCGLEESEGHRHTDSCYEKVLTCGKEVHTHSDACYRADKEVRSAAVASTGTTSAAAEIQEDNTSDFSIVPETDAVSEAGSGKTAGSGKNDRNDESVDADADHDSFDAGDAEADDKDVNVTDTDDSADNKNKKTDNHKDTDGDEEEDTSSWSTGFAADEDGENGDVFIPDKDALDFSTVLNNKTGIYYHHVAEDEDLEDSSVITDWARVDEDTELDPQDIIRVYLSYTLPKDTINATNDISRYRLPDTLHLTDGQIEAINSCENGISAQYIDYDDLEITDPERHTVYLGLESVEGSRRPGQEPKEDSPEYISAVVRAEKICDDDTGEYEGTDLIFTFSPYAVEKNAHAYDKKGQPTRAGEEVTGWLTLDFNMGQIDWSEDNTSEIVFAEEDEENDISEISTVLRQADSADAGTDESAADGTTEEAAEYAAEETAAAATTAEIAAEDSTEAAAGEAAAEAATSPEKAAESSSAKADADAKKDSENAKDNKDENKGDENKEESSAADYPAAVFDDSVTVSSGRLDTDLADTDIPKKTKMTVHVEADEGTFPEGTKMVLSPVEDLDAVAEAVGTAVDSKTRGFQAVDITFYDKDPSAEDAKEIQPLKPIRVSIKSDEIRKAAEDSSTAPVVVHIEDKNKAAGNENTDSGKDDIPAASIVETKTISADTNGTGDEDNSRDTDQSADTNETGDQDRSAGTDESADADKSGDQDRSAGTDESADKDESVDTDQSADNRSGSGDRAGAASADDTVVFEASSFSVYAIVYTVDFHAEVISASGDTYEVTVRYEADAMIPEGAELKVREILPEDEEYQAVQEKAGKELAEEMKKAIPAHPVLLDIAIYDGETKIEPAEGSKVQVEVKLVKDSITGIYSDEDSPILINDEPVKDEELQNAQKLQVIHDTEAGELDVVEVREQNDDEHVVGQFTTDSFSNWLVFLDEDLADINVTTSDSLTLRPYTEWVWKTSNGQQEGNWTFPDSAWTRENERDQWGNQVYENNQPVYIYTHRTNGSKFRAFSKYDGQLHETYTVITSTQLNAGNFDIQNDKGKTIHVHVTQGSASPAPAPVPGVPNLTVNLFDYDVPTKNGQLDFTRSGNLDSSGNKATTVYNETVNIGHNLKFLGWGADGDGHGVNSYTNEYAKQEIVKDELSGGFPVLNDGSNQKLDYLFDVTSKNSSVYAFPNAGGLFQKDNQGYYFYNSNVNYTKYDQSTNQFILYGHTYSQNTGGSSGANAKPIGFFPFHDYDTHETQPSMNHNKDLNHHFGMSMTVNFEVPKDRQMEDESGHKHDIIYEFSGDDDLWVFVDDELALDIGGIHQPVTGSINFTTGVIKVHGKDDITKTFDVGGHTLKMFYLERGGCDSNLSVRFNLPLVLGKAGVNVAKKSDANASSDPDKYLPGAVFGIWENADCSGEPYKTGTSDANGHIDFGDLPIKVEGQKYYLKEMVPPRGYMPNTTVFTVTAGQKDANGNYSFTISDGTTPVETIGQEPVYSVIRDKKPEPINLSVQKQWQNADGTEMENPDGSASFEVKRYYQYIEGSVGPENSIINVYRVNQNWSNPLLMATKEYAGDSMAYVNWTYNQLLGQNYKNWQYKINNGAIQTKGNNPAPITMPAGQTTNVYIFDGNLGTQWEQYGVENITVTGTEPSADVGEITTGEGEDTEYHGPVITLPTSAGAWSDTFSNLTATEQKGNRTYYYSYYIVEKPVPAGFEAVYVNGDNKPVTDPSSLQTNTSGTQTIINRKLMDVPVLKDWEDFSGEEFTWTADFQLEERELKVNASDPDAADAIAQWTAVDGKTLRVTKGQTPTPVFTGLPRFRVHSNGTVYRILYSVEEIAYEVKEGETVVSKWDAEHGHTIGHRYTPQFTQDAGGNEQGEKPYEIKVANTLHNPTVTNTINLSLKKEWTAGGSDYNPGNGASARFVLKRFYHEEYRNYSHVENMTDLVTITLDVAGTGTNPTITVPRGAMVSISGKVLAGVNANSIQFTRQDGTLLTKIIDNTTSQSLKPFDITFEATQNETVTLFRGDNYVSGGREGFRLTDHGDQNTPKVDKHFSQEFTLDDSVNWIKQFSSLPQIEEDEMDEVSHVQTITVYTYYFEEVDCTPSGFHPVFETTNGQLLADENNPVDTSQDLIAENQANEGSLKLKKLVRVNEFDPLGDNVSDADKTKADGTYTFTIEGKEGTRTAGLSHTVTITVLNGAVSSATIDGSATTLSSDGSVLLSGLVTGQYTVTEEESANTVCIGVSAAQAATTDVDNRTVEITVVEDVPDVETQQVQYTNNYASSGEDIAHVSVRKTFIGLRPNEIPTNFQVNATVKAKIDGVERTFTYTLKGPLNQQQDGVTLTTTTQDGNPVWNWRIAIAGLRPDAVLTIEETGYPVAGYEVSTTTNGVANKTKYEGTVSADTVIQNFESHVFTPNNVVTFPVNDTGDTATIFMARLTSDKTTLVISKNRLTLSEKAKIEEQLQHMENAEDWTHGGNAVLYYNFEEAGSNQIIVKGRTVTYSDTNGGQITFNKKCQWTMVGRGDITYVPGRPADVNFVNRYTEIPLEIDIVKVDKENSSTKLKGAVFTLRKLSGPVDNPENPPEPLPSGEFAGTVVGDSLPTAPDTGKTSFSNLTSGYYEITEKTAPQGYVLTDDIKIYFKIEGGVASKIEWSADQSKWIEKPNDAIVSFAPAQEASGENPATNATFTVGNERGAELPSTGGPGTRLFTILGSILILGAGVLLWRRRRLI